MYGGGPVAGNHVRGANVVSSFAIAVVVLACVFGGALLGRQLRALLPEHHLKDDTKDIVKLAIGLIATLAALVLGLLISSAKESFSNVSNELTNVSVKMIQLDRALARYGPETAPIRARIKQTYSAAVDQLFSGDPQQLAKLDSPEVVARGEALHNAIQQLAPRDDIQRGLQSQALALTAELFGARWLVLLQGEGTMSWPLLVVLVAWLTVNFTAFGLFGPRNATLLVALFMCALCVSGAIFLILEMDRPLEGWVRISDAQMRAALAHLGQ